MTKLTTQIEGDYSDEVDVIYDKVIDTDRWSTHCENVFKKGDRYYKTYYSRGSTEIQDEAPYEYEDEWVEVTEVVPKEVTVTKYMAKEAE